MDFIGLYTPDGTTFPNFALMKIAKYHEGIGDYPILLDGLNDYDPGLFARLYCSSVFTYSPRDGLPEETVQGGSGFDLSLQLPTYIEEVEPQYSVYPALKTGIGFLTRGCIRNCDFCIVSQKEGRTKPYRDILTVCQGRKSVVLCDNNVLSHPFGIEQIEKCAEHGIRVDFNQGLDARLINHEIAQILGKVKWLSPVRLACDDDSMIDSCVRAIELLRWYNVRPKRYLVYVLAKDVKSSMRRLMVLKGMGVMPFLQPFRDRMNSPISHDLSQLARWVNAGGGRIFHSCSFEEYVKIRGNRI